MSGSKVAREVIDGLFDQARRTVFKRGIQKGSQNAQVRDAVERSSREAVAQATQKLKDLEKLKRLGQAGTLAVGGGALLTGSQRDQTDQGGGTGNNQTSVQEGGGSGAESKTPPAGAYGPDKKTTPADLDINTVLVDVLGKLIDPKTMGDLADVQGDLYERKADITSRATMEQTRELTRREIEKQTIQAWRGITEAEIQRDTAMGLGMMQIAYQSGMPNPNQLTAAANFVQQGRAGFTTPQAPN